MPKGTPKPAPSELDPLPSPDRDPLLTVEEVARRMQLTTVSVSDLVAQGRLISLDRGLLISQGAVNVPLIRASSVERAHKGRDPSKIKIDHSHGEGMHPAASVALDLIDAIQQNDSTTVVALSSTSSLLDVGSPEQLLATWREALGDAIWNAAVASNGYFLEGFDAIAIRLVANPLPLTVVIERPTPMAVSGVIPFRRENGQWRADLGLWKQHDAWIDQLWET